VEIGKNNRIEQTPIHDLNLPANPHGYWLFGSLDFQSGNMISSATPSTSWVMLPIVIPQNLLRKKERKVGENSKYLIVENGVFLTIGR